jgi:hypothetical protein
MLPRVRGRENKKMTTQNDYTTATSVLEQQEILFVIELVPYRIIENDSCL